MAGRPLALAHPDWLYQELTVTGEARALRRFQAAAAGAGVIPWVLDYDRLEEDWFHLLVTQPRVRTISIPGARALARQLREAVWERHEEAVSRTGSVRFCPLDLHELVPVPRNILRLGPDDPDARAWLWENWGTTWPLRHVRPLPIADPPPSIRCGFWSADWTPWRALVTIRRRHPALNFAFRMMY